MGGINIEPYAEAAYASYSEAVGGKAWNGDPLPSYCDLSEDRKEGWRAAAWSVIKQINSKL